MDTYLITRKATCHKDSSHTRTDYYDAMMLVDEISDFWTDDFDLTEGDITRDYDLAGGVIYRVSSTKFSVEVQKVTH